MMPETETRDQIREVWDKRWQGSEHKERITLIGKMMFRAKQRALSDVLKKIKIKNMLEAGCGLGYTLTVFSKAGIDALGIDISEYAVAVCKNKGLHARLQALEEVRGEFELVSSDGLLEHFSDFKPYAHILMRVCSKYVLLIQPNHNSILGKCAVFLAEAIHGRCNVKEYNHPLNDFIKVFAEGGFELLENKPLFGDVFRLLLFKR
jgi:cyclopropane fatty-acyl-phospholipid synthase-like methyltransferase